MFPDDFFSPENMRKWMVLSSIVSIAIAWIVYNITEDMILAAAIGGFLVLGDYIALQWLKDKQDKD